MTIKFRTIEKKEYFTRCPQCSKEIKGKSEFEADKNLQSHYYFIHTLRDKKEEVKE